MVDKDVKLIACSPRSKKHYCRIVVIFESIKTSSTGGFAPMGLVWIVAWADEITLFVII